MIRITSKILPALTLLILLFACDEDSNCYNPYTSRISIGFKSKNTRKDTVIFFNKVYVADENYLPLNDSIPYDSVKISPLTFFLNPIADSTNLIFKSIADEEMGIMLIDTLTIHYQIVQELLSPRCDFTQKLTIVNLTHSSQHLDSVVLVNTGIILKSDAISIISYW